MARTRYNESRILYICAICMIVLIVFVAYVYYKHTSSKTPRIQGWIVNMDKNKDRMVAFEKTYRTSDLSSHLHVHRFPAVVGADVDPAMHLSETALAELHDVEAKGHRTYHYQLSRGAIGCFLSHYYIMKKLAESSRYDAFLMLEDDILLPRDFYKRLTNVLQEAPPEWDIILLGYHRVRGDAINDMFYKVDGFWGTFGYLITQKGAQKFIEQVGIHKVDAQIDAFMSYLRHYGIFKIYAVKDQIVNGNYEIGSSDVQAHHVTNGEDDNTIMYRGILV